MNKLFKSFLAVVMAFFAVITVVGCDFNATPTEKFTVSVVEGTGAGVYEQGSSAKVTANNKGEDYDFLGWYEGEVKLSENVEYTFEVTKDIVLAAKFEYNPYKNLSENEKNDYINDQNLAFANRFDETTNNYWDGWTTTVALNTEVKSPLSSDKSAKVTLAAMKNANDEFISDAAAGCGSVGGAWSTIDMGLFGKTVNVLEYDYLEFDVKFENAQQWFSVRFLDKDGNLSTELGHDIPDATLNKKMLTTDGWLHIVVDLNGKYNYTVLNGEDPISGSLLDNYNVLSQAVKLRFAFSNSQSNWKNDSVIYVDNVKLSKTPFDATEIENQVREQMAAELAEEADLTNKITVAWNPDNFTWTKGEDYSKGEGSTYGFQLVYPAREGDDTWPRIQLNLNQVIDFTANDVTIDVKPVSNHPWIEIHYYDSNWAEIAGATKGYDLTAGQWNTIELKCTSTDVQLITIYVTSKGTNVANELWFDNLTVTAKPATHPNKAQFAGDQVNFNTTISRADFAQYEKGFSFEFTMTEGVTYMAFMDGPHSWANFTGNIKFERIGDVVTCDKGTVEAIENGWYKATIPYVNFAGDGEEKVADCDAITMIYYNWKDNLTAETVYVDLDSLKVADVESHPNKVEYKDSTSFVVNTVNKADFAAANKGVYFEFAMTEGSFTVAVMDGTHGWANYTGPLGFTRTGTTVTCSVWGTSYEVTPIGGNWYSVVIPYAKFRGDGEQNKPDNDRIDLLYGTVAADTTVFIDPTSFKGVTLTEAHPNKEEYKLNNVFDANKVNLADALVEGKAIYFEFTMTDGVVGFCLLADWANITGDFKVTKDGDSVTVNRNATITDLGDGWYGITISNTEFTGDGDRNNAENMFINRLYYRWTDNVTAEKIYVDFTTVKIVNAQ